MVFTAGAPGSGKTYTVHSIYDLDRVEMLDLDVEMKQHPRYDRAQPERIYDENDAYTWANDRVEDHFQEVLCRERGNSDEARLVCFDGTGTHVERQKRRMREAKTAGFWIILLYVRVSLGTCLERNRNRARTVPEAVLKDYIVKLDDAVEEVRGESGLVDEYIQVFNDYDDSKTEAQRWGSHADWVGGRSAMHRSIFGG